MCRRIGENGEKFITDGAGVLTHCNAGALATAGQGTALSVMFEAKRQGRRFKVYADETRPLLQGARLTAWELQQAGINVTVICDSMAAYLMKQGRIDLVITGADRIAANGDTANKIGTYSLSVLAAKHGVPFYIAAPSGTFDLSIKAGDQILIEERSPVEVAFYGGTRTVPKDVNVYNPAFDVTPAENITAIITDRGVIENPSTEKITAHF
jgi:methylthioribose-1-phosphate isomerase